MCEKHSSLSASRLQRTESKVGVNRVVDSARLSCKTFLSGRCLQNRADKFIMIFLLGFAYGKKSGPEDRRPGLMWRKTSLKSRQVCYITLFNEVLDKDKRLSSFTEGQFPFLFFQPQISQDFGFCFVTQSTKIR